MTIGIFTTVSHGRGDTFVESMQCYSELADVVVVVDGEGSIYKKVKGEYKLHSTSPKWEQEFSWEFIGQQFQRGYEALDTDFVIHADLDFIFHEKDFKAISKAMEDNPDAPALSFYKYQFILPDRYNLKSRLVIAVNKGKYGDRIRFDSGGDLCQPSLDGKEIKPDDVPEARIPFYNYEKLTKTKEQIKDDIERMDRAYKRHFGKWLYSHDGRNAYGGWLKMATGRFSKPQEHIALEDHPKYIQETIMNLNPDQFGFNGLGNLEENDYVKGFLLC